jgi:hypothetical protein
MKTPKYKYKTKGEMTARDHVSYHCLINGVIPEKGIELVHSKEVAMESAARRSHRDNAVMYSEDASHNRTSSRINANTGRTLDKGIQLYRLWFRYLKLALELEEMKVSLVIKNEFLERGAFRHDKRVQNVPEEVKVRIRKQFAERILKEDLKGSDHAGGKYEAVWRLKHIEKVKVKRSAYKGWDLDQVLTDSFDNWWKTHSYLFEGHTPKFINPKDVSEDNNNFLYIRIDKTSQRRDVQMFFNDEVAKQLKGKTKNLFKVVGKSPRVNVIQNNYNALVLSLKGWTPKEINNHKNIYNRRTDESVLSVRGDGDSGRPKYSSDKSLVTNISKSKRIGAFRLMEVCEGQFGISPPTNW